MFVVVQPTGFLPHYIYSWNGTDAHWLPRLDLAKRFTRREAQQIADTLNAQRPTAVNLVTIQPVKESCHART